MPEFKALTDNSLWGNITFEAFQALMKGKSILAIEASDRSLYMDLAGDLRMEIQVSDGKDTQFLLSPTLREDKLPSIKVQLLTEEEPEASLIGLKLWHLRRVYAIAYLVSASPERAEKAAGLLVRRRFVDLELELIPCQDRLCIEGAGPGSWAIWTFVKKAARRPRKHRRPRSIASRSTARKGAICS